MADAPVIFGQESDLDSDRAHKVVCPRHPHLRWRTAAETLNIRRSEFPKSERVSDNPEVIPGAVPQQSRSSPDGGLAEETRIGRGGLGGGDWMEEHCRGGCGIVIGGHFDEARICMRMVAGR